MIEKYHRCAEIYRELDAKGVEHCAALMNEASALHNAKRLDEAAECKLQALALIMLEKFDSNKDGRVELSIR